ncbi:Trk system potassium transporter TrkA [Chakrabartyella piscis]|uniref:Trk system potassium transporter TrkA n=1 Tax=Chakrabartyella piscis TaxID=2918914 RepID=UPI00295835C7|nr:Trk system potassium transporter TrkA [Chakrabartyella piscis]
MKIVIIGDGKVGSTIAEQLSLEGHDVIIIDRENSALFRSGNIMDLICIEGNGATVETQNQAGVGQADALIAATSADEVNMLCCLLGKKLGAKYTVARVRDPEYFKQMNLIKEDLGINMAVNPEFTTAQEISRLLRFPFAQKIELFARGGVELVEMKIQENNPLHGMALFEVYKELGVRVLICAVQRDGEVVIPSGNFVLQKGDKINITASHNEISKFFKRLGVFRTAAKSVMIVGGSRLAYYLAMDLIAINIKVKIIEKDMKRCEYLCEKLPEAVIIHGDGTDKELLQEEGLESTDALVMLTGMDEENIVVALYGKMCNVSKVIAKINKLAFYEILDRLDLDSIISPKAVAANHIVRYIRSRKAGGSGNRVETLIRLVNDQVEAVEFRVSEASPVVGIPLKDLKRKKQTLVAIITRGARVIIPTGDDSIQVGDYVVIVTTEKRLLELDDILL